jgi:hypothetical protein
MNKIDRTNENSIRAGIKSVCNRSAGLQKDIQLVALGCLQQVRDHDNKSLAMELIEGITKTKSQKSSKLTQWFEAFMHASYIYDEGKGKNVFAYDESKCHTDIVMEQAELVNWFDFKAPTEDKSKDLPEILESLTKTLKTSVTKSKVTLDESESILQTVRDLIAARTESEGETNVNDIKEAA